LRSTEQQSATFFAPFELASFLIRFSKAISFSFFGCFFQTPLLQKLQKTFNSKESENARTKEESNKPLEQAKYGARGSHF